MNSTRQGPNRLLLTLALLVIVPVGLGAQQHQHHTRDSASMRHGEVGEMMNMGDTMHGGTWMDMISMMPGGNTMMGMPASSLMQRVMSLQPGFVLSNAEVLSLNAEQVSQLEQLVAAQETVHQEHMRSLLEDTQSLSELFDSDDANIEDIRALAESAMRPFRAMQWRAVTDARAVRDLLTPSQREKASSLPLHGPMMMDPQRGMSMPHREHQLNSPS